MDSPFRLVFRIGAISILGLSAVVFIVSAGPLCMWWFQHLDKWLGLVK